MIDVRGLFGKRVSSEKRLKRVEKWINNVRHKSWTAIPERVEGVFIGARNYSQGFNDWIGPYEGSAWCHVEAIRVGLIVPDPYQKPIPVPIDSVLLLEGNREVEREEEKPIDVLAYRQCPKCKGRGAIGDFPPRLRCERCNGEGIVPRDSVRERKKKIEEIEIPLFQELKK